MFSVEWLQSALDNLAELWANSDSAARQVLNAACNEMDPRLARDPNNEGESRPQGRRITFVAPLAAIFRVDPVQRIVTVIRIYRFRRRSRS